MHLNSSFLISTMGLIVSALRACEDQMGSRISKGSLSKACYSWGLTVLLLREGSQGALAHSSWEELS